MTPGRIIFLNGTSSSGKSSIARELLDILDDGVFFHLAVDAFNAMRSKRELVAAELDAALRRTRTGFHRSIAAMADAGNDLVDDKVHRVHRQGRRARGAMEPEGRRQLRPFTCVSWPGGR
ncbi:hypothetical protein AB0G87_02650 [Streptomyces asoensis]|uniref:phosphotransferase-like protein n=1 Tax=Streptomyces asoensis TaxID=249586 RepID=UPI0033E8BE73